MRKKILFHFFPLLIQTFLSSYDFSRSQWTGKSDYYYSPDGYKIWCSSTIARSK